jgi:hypothetical protein
MRKTETIELGDDPKVEVKIRELTVEQILGIFDKWQNAAKIEGDEIDEAGTFIEEIEKVFEMSVSGIGFKELNRYAPSELREMWDTFKGVNSVFFEAINSMGITESLSGLIKATKDDLLKIFQDSSNAVTPTS